MIQLRLFIILLLTSSANSSPKKDFENVKNQSSLVAAESSISPITVTEIPLAAILKDLREGLVKPEKGDLAGVESNLKRTIVGVKKHKNYEIVLYEYSDEEGLRGDKDFDIPDLESEVPSNRKGGKKQQRRKQSRKAQEPRRQKPQLRSKEDNPLPNDKQAHNLQKTPPSNPNKGTTSQKSEKNKNKPAKKKFDDDDEEDSNQVEDTEGEDLPEYSEEDYDEDLRSRRPFTWGQRDKSRNHKSKPHNRAFPFPYPDDENDEEEDEEGEDLDEYGSDEDDDSDIFLNRRPSKTSKSSKTSKTSQGKPESGRNRNNSVNRKTLQDAPGAGKFTPRRRPSVLAPSGNRTDDEDSDEIDEAFNDSEEVGRKVLCKDPTGKTGICEEYFKCSVLYTTNAGRINLQDYKCRLGSEIGICCPVFREQDTRGQRGRALMKTTDKKKPLSRQIKKLIRSNVNNSIIFGSDSVAQLDEIEQDLFSRGGEVSKNSPAFVHNRFFPSSKKIRQVSEVGFELLQTTNDLSDRLQLTNDIGGLGLKSFKSSNTRAINDRCPRLPPCGINKYRLIDGSCNNLRKQKMGQSLTPLSRVLEPAYADGRWEPRISARGFLLPSARLLSQTFIQDRDNPNSMYTLMVMQLGQFIDHDISSVPIFTFANGTGISCCRNGQFLPPSDRHPNCLPIEIPANDPFYGRFGQRCMNFVRSRMAPRIDCSLGYADQMNAVTHWLDLSNVYGSTETEMRDLRLFQGGLLQFSELADRKMLLPLKRTQTRELDYKAGDDRVNEMQGLMVMHLIWLREHNRIAIELERINPFWNDEQLFQEARRIAIAEYQHILYNEWLPIIVGREYMESYGILPLSQKKFFKGYDPEIDASIESSFSSAGFRMGHSLVQGIVRLIDEFGRANEASTISNHAENAERTRSPNQIDKWLRGLAQQPIQSFDPYVTQHINGRLFQARGGMFGMDLSSLNIQRGRDHGVPGYNSFRQLCQTGKRARTFDDFRDWIAPEIVEQMRRIYDHPDDVDLWIGGISEAPLKGALIGPTFTCIVGDQFARTKKGDRYFYDIGDQTHSFSPDQVQELRKASMARIMCDNGDALEAIQPSVFLQPDFDFNSLVDCRRSRRIPRINLRLWENEPTP